MGGVLSVFLGSLQTFRMTDSLSRIQESGRFALEIMRRDIRQAGYYGCLQSFASESPRLAGPLTSGLIRNTLNPAPLGATDNIAFEFDFSNGLLGYEANVAEDDTVGASGDWTIQATSYIAPTGIPSSSQLPVSGILINPLKGRDIVAVSRATGVGVEVTAHTTDADPLTVTAGHGFASGEIALVTDCNSAAIFEISAAGATALTHDVGVGSPGNYTASFGRVFNNAEVMGVSRVVYYIAANPVTGRPGLYRNDQEVAENIERMQLRYGEDITNDRRVNEYRSADAVQVWDNVLSIRIDLLISSGEEDNLVETPVSVALPGQAAELATDSRLYRAFSATAVIRNRVP